MLDRPAPMGVLADVGVQVLGGRVQRTVDPRKIGALTKPFWALLSRPAVTSQVSDFCGLDDPSFENSGVCGAKGVLSRRNQLRIDRPDGGSGARINL